MTTQQLEPLSIDPSEVGSLDLGGVRVPYVDIEDAEYVHSHIVLGDTTYAYDRSFPIKGHSAVMPQAVAELQGAGKRILVVEREERYVIYVA